MGKATKIIWEFRKQKKKTTKINDFQIYKYHLDDAMKNKGKPINTYA